MKTKSILLSTSLIIILISTFVLPTSALADGIIIPEPPPCNRVPCPPVVIPMDQLVIRYHHVTVTIKDQLAVTHVDQVFYNPNDWTIEGTYIFPIPDDAAISGFTLWVDGKPVEGKVLDATQARLTYEQIVSSMRDPALLEYIGRGAVQARIFPIEPQSERRIEIEYSQVLTSEGGLVHYVYPLNTEKFSAQPIESVTISVDIQADVPIRAVYSPSHEVGVSRDSDKHVKVGYEAANVLPNIDFALYYSLGESEAFHLLTYRDSSDSSDPNGFFLIMLAPRINITEQVIPKDILLVLDRSGSMDGEKFQQAHQAAQYILGKLNPEDRFNIITFSTGIQTYASGLRPASEASRAQLWVERLRAEGSTDINRALLEAASMVDPERSTYLIFMTDGLPTEGEIDRQTILSNFSANAPDNLRLFAFGVGYDVDTILLDNLTQDHHGRSTYVQPGMNLDETLSSFYNGISSPVLTNLELDFDGVSTNDLYPFPLPDLFVGSQVIVLGRYSNGGTGEIKLTGKVNGETQTFTFPGQVFEKESASNSIQASIPRLWATRKIGYLLSQIHLQGANQEIIDQIVRLSIRYGIVTPYTSYLVTEKAPLGAAEQQRLADETYGQMLAMPTAAAGQAAVQSAANAGAMQGAEKAPELIGEASSTVQVLGSRTYVYSEGKWIDTAFDPDTMKLTQIQFLSPEYFALVADNDVLADAFSLGDQVIALSDGKAYEVVNDGTIVQQVNPTPIPGSITTDTPILTPTARPGTSPMPTQAATQTSANQPSGICGAAILPLFLIPLMFVFIKKPAR